MNNERLDKIEELLNMAATQTANNAIQLEKHRLEFQKSLQESHEQHNKEMGEIREFYRDLQKLVKNLIIKISY